MPRIDDGFMVQSNQIVGFLMNPNSAERQCRSLVRQYRTLQLQSAVSGVRNHQENEPLTGLNQGFLTLV
jgi:hypothetical protein